MTGTRYIALSGLRDRNILHEGLPPSQGDAAPLGLLVSYISPERANHINEGALRKGKARSKAPKGRN